MNAEFKCISWWHMDLGPGSVSKLSDLASLSLRFLMHKMWLITLSEVHCDSVLDAQGMAAQTVASKSNACLQMQAISLL